MARAECVAVLASSTWRIRRQSRRPHVSPGEGLKNGIVPAPALALSSGPMITEEIRFPQRFRVLCVGFTSTSTSTSASTSTTTCTAAGAAATTTIITTTAPTATTTRTTTTTTTTTGFSCRLNNNPCRTKALSRLETAQRGPK